MSDKIVVQSGTFFSGEVVVVTDQVLNPGVEELQPWQIKLANKPVEKDYSVIESSIPKVDVEATLTKMRHYGYGFDQMSEEERASVDMRSYKAVNMMLNLQTYRLNRRNPYHTTILPKDVLSEIPKDHVYRTAFFSTFFAMKTEGYTEENILAAFLAGIGHDLVLGKNHEEVSACLVQNILEFVGYDKDFVVMVVNAIRSTQIKFDGENFSQIAALNRVGTVVAAADVLVSGGNTYEKFIRDSLLVRLENQQIALGDSLSIELFEKEIQRMFDIFTSVTYPDQVPVVKQLFPNKDANLDRLKRTIDRIKVIIEKYDITSVSSFDMYEMMIDPDYWLNGYLSPNLSAAVERL